MKKLCALWLFVTPVTAHDWSSTDRETMRAHLMQEWLVKQAPQPSQSMTTPSDAPAGWKARTTLTASTASTLQLAAAAMANAANAPQTAKAFLPFPKLDLRADDAFLYVGSNGMPDHNMMVGITAWQQQVPLPQKYFDDNAWRIPLKPTPAKEPTLIKGRFLRGAIALAVNGVPIFNPQNNRGELSQEIGELDQWGGHCGRGDDYHYHAAPLHLQSVVGQDMPIAYALDGYPIYGLTEPDSSPVSKLDACHGHETAGMGYHYHAAMKYPYVFAGFHGEVTEIGGQVDPQPRAHPVRPDTPPLRGAVITGFQMTDANTYQLSYSVGSDKRSITYRINEDGTYPFEYDNGREGKTREVYTARRAGGGGEGGGGPAAGGKSEPKGKGKAKSGGRAEDQPRSSDGKFLLASAAFDDLDNLPAAFTGDGEGLSPPLQWAGAPAATQGFAVIMDHDAPDGEKKGYWTLYEIPRTVTSLPKDSQQIGKRGVGFKGAVGYEPPNSKGPGAKTYVITLYALASPLDLRGTPRREEVMAAMEGKVLASSSLRVVHTTSGAVASDRGPAPTAGKTKGKPKGGPPGLIKPSITDTMKLNVYADNWFMLYVNGRLVAVDPIPFTPHNVVSVDFLPEYPMTLAVLAKDNADPKTGMEYGSSIGDGGFILKFADGTVTNASWKAKTFFHGPIHGNTAQPRVTLDPLPANWWAVAFDDSSWRPAKEYTVEEVDPKQPFFENDFEGAKFIWTDDLALDNTVIFRTKIEKPDWTPRWNTRPDLDVTGAPTH